MNLYFIKSIIRFCLRIFQLIPLKKKSIFLDSFDGKELCCNPYYIFEKLKNTNNNLTFYIASLESKKKSKNIKYVKVHSFNWLIAQITCKVLIINTGFKTFIPYRKKQILINTWHGGGAYKKVGAENQSIQNNKEIERNIKYVNKYLTYFITSSQKFS